MLLEVEDKNALHPVQRDARGHRTEGESPEQPVPIQHAQCGEWVELGAVQGLSLGGRETLREEAVSQARGEYCRQTGAGEEKAEVISRRGSYGGPSEDSQAQAA